MGPGVPGRDRRRHAARDRAQHRDGHRRPTSLDFLAGGRKAASAQVGELAARRVHDGVRVDRDA
ncbi:hypothetical protein LUX57_44810 [Actinomadura madurae]|nr:hypothetical protein [Actinomadura madurae]MCP9971366.1 hypothetical protein [Actinomadura madurae]